MMQYASYHTLNSYQLYMICSFILNKCVAFSFYPCDRLIHCYFVTVATCIIYYTLIFYKKLFIGNPAIEKKFKKLTAWIISIKIKKLAILLTVFLDFYSIFQQKLRNSCYFSAKIKKLTGWIFDKFLIKKLFKNACMNT